MTPTGENRTHVDTNAEHTVEAREQVANGT